MRKKSNHNTPTDSPAKELPAKEKDTKTATGMRVKTGKTQQVKTNRKNQDGGGEKKKETGKKKDENESEHPKKTKVLKDRKKTNVAKKVILYLI